MSHRRHHDLPVLTASGLPNELYLHVSGGSVCEMEKRNIDAKP